MTNNNKGFTLTEILLATLVVAIIGISLASLTTAASREGGVGRSKVMLRNGMSRAMRQLRQDMHEASRVLFVRGSIGDTSDTQIPLLMLGKNVRLDGTPITGTSRTYVLYCFVPGSITTTAGEVAVVPTGATDGGTIYRQVWSPTSAYTFPENSNTPTCRTLQDQEIWLQNVKFIKNTVNAYMVPLFQAEGYSGIYSINDNTDANINNNLGSLLRVRLILELPSSPVVNDVTEEKFSLPNGFSITVNS